MSKIYFVTSDFKQLHSWSERELRVLPRAGETIRIKDERYLVKWISHDIGCFDIFVVLDPKPTIEVAQKSKSKVTTTT